jgi:phage baseplate assembly protein V
MAFSEHEMRQINDLVMNRLRNMFARGEVKKVTKGKTTKLKVEFLNGEIYDGIEMPNQYGQNFHPPVGSEVIALFLGGNRDHGSVLSVFNKGHTNQDTLEEGETSLYDKNGSQILVKADGSIHITPNGGTVYINGNLVVSEDVSDQKGSMEEMRGYYNPHTHDGSPPPDPQMT